MIRDVELVSYLPPFIQEYQEPVEALKAENPEFLIIWKAADRILSNHFISTADEYGISRFEKMLGILPLKEDTLEGRRSRVQSKWFNSIPYTMRMLLQKIAVLCGDTDFEVLGDVKGNYTIQIHTSLELFGQVEQLKAIVDEVLPCNIVVVFENEVKMSLEGNISCAGGITYTDMIEIIN